ncbi:helix-turn-helix domain-containing protein [Vibrio rumoiensis]|uniref:helix-turn-helix domain-containing protein n=1 Tax=Vibrio rumoiensis TaxID=76258 RepID=UPI003AA8D9B5
MSKPLTTSETKAIQWAFFDRMDHIKGNDAYLLMTLCRFANHEHSCWRTIKSLSEIMRVSERTIIRSIKNLEKLGAILTVRKRSSQTKSHPNTYILNIHGKQLDWVNLTSSNALDSDNLTPSNALDSDNLSPTNGFDSDNLSSLIVTTCPNHSDNLSPTNGFDSDNLTLSNSGDSDSLSPASVDKLEGNNFDSDNLSSLIVTTCPNHSDNLSPKYKVNINNNINTGVESKLTTSEDLFLKNDSFPKAMDYWFFIKTKIKNDFKKFLSNTPSDQDFEAMEYIQDIYDIDMNIRYNWQLLYKFVIERLGEPEAILNPAVRLMLATDAHPQKDLAFVDDLDKFDFMPVGEDEDLSLTE